MTSTAALALDDIRALFAASKLQDRILNDAIIDDNRTSEVVVSSTYQYASGDIEMFEGRGKTPYDAFVALSREIRNWMYGESAVTQNDDFAAYSAAAISSGSGSTKGGLS